MRGAAMRMRETLRAALLAALAAGAPGVSFVTTAQAALPDFTQLIEDVAPAVVNIAATRRAAGREGGMPPEMPFPEGSPWHEFFKRFFDEREAPRSAPNPRGSGFVISRDGLIVTNYHVVADADEILVKFSDRRELPAELVGGDALTDLALLRVRADKLPVATLAERETLTPGQWVVAIGAPFGFEYSATAGIVSALGRSLPGESHVPFVQTDVAINPGNSGGPLFNLDGEVVGINSQIYSRTGSYAGLSFAIPIGFATRVLDQLRDKGRASHGWLGIYTQEVTHDLARSFGLDKPAGALVAGVVPDSPAEQAELQIGDIVLEFNGERVPRAGALAPMVGAAGAGEDARLGVLRDGDALTLTVTLGELPERFVRRAAGGREPPPSEAVLGMRVRALDAEERETLELEHGALLVEDLQEGPAMRAGVRKGDVILRLDGRRVESAAELREIVAGLPGDRFATLLLRRDDRSLFVAVKIPAKE